MRLHTGEKKGMPFQISTSASPVPDLPPEPGDRGAREHGVAAGPTIDRVAVPADLPCRPVDPGGPQPHVDAAVGPPLEDLVRVQLGPTGLCVIEVAPGHDVDPPNAGRGRPAG